PAQDSSTFSQGFATLTVNTDVGTFTAYVVKYPLSSTRVLTLTANEDDCANNCPAKSLQSYVAENSGFAGIHGNYFCPPDYASCVNKVYAYDYAVYNSNLNKWLNEVSLTWQNLGLITFVETLPHLENHYNFNQFYATPSVTAGILNYPSLVSSGELVVGNFTLTSYQNTKGYRGAIGYDSASLYLVIASGASVTDMAHVMKALGATNALNLDGGGSSALYYEGSYKVGPGRLLPNAIVLQRR
ncbi:phosphodiester glycosidase family protein, partial [Patescibacteria group bacterium]|nr:phosphodiester glycosidase family protein [Patescibacteria group bacterium]